MYYVFLIVLKLNYFVVFLAAGLFVCQNGLFLKYSVNIEYLLSLQYASLVMEELKTVDSTDENGKQIN